MLESFQSDKFTYKRIPVEEQKARGILGRLVGVIADTKNSTRNGRKYSADLWENVFNNDIMKEKIANRCLFGELGHPTDREETDMEKIAICLSEQPKVGSDGKIYGVFDILSTPNGRILKSLCDYGCTIGVSSRGTGDLYTDADGEESVDPDTYNCEAWDAVLIPAVKEARLQYVTESLDTKRYNKTLRQSLQESLEKASEEDKKVMTEALDTLGIDLNESVLQDLEDDHARVKKEYGQKAYDELDRYLSEVPDTDLGDTLYNQDKWKEFADWYKSENGEDLKVNEGWGDYKEYDNWDPADVELHKNTDWRSRNWDDLEVPEDSFEGEVTMYKHNAEPEKKVVKFTKHIRPNAIFPPYYAASEKPFENSVGAMYDGNRHGMYDIHDRYEDQETYDALSEECSSESCADKEEKEVVNDKSDKELVAEFQESLVKIKNLEDNNLELQEKLSVCNAKEVELAEQVAKYKEATIRLSESAKKVKSLNKELDESKAIIERKNARIKSLTESSVSRSKEAKENDNKLTEALEKINQLTEQLENLNKEVETKGKQLSEAKQTISKYQKAYKSLKESYIGLKATNYGIKKQDILNKLNESYSLRDIDSVCEELSKFKRNINKLPFRIDEGTKISVNTVNESLLVNKPASDDYVSDSLLRLANL